MNIYKTSGIVNRDIDLLAPFVKRRALDGIAMCQNAVSIYEGYRTPTRQEILYAQGRTSPGAIVTKAKPWKSWHQYGLAIDIAFLVKGQWSWNGDFAAAAMAFKHFGFEWLHPFEEDHFQLTGGLDVDEAHEITQNFGLPTLWNMVKQKIGEF